MVHDKNGRLRFGWRETLALVGSLTGVGGLSIGATAYLHTSIAGVQVNAARVTQQVETNSQEIANLRDDVRELTHKIDELHDAVLTLEALARAPRAAAGS